MPLRLEDKRRIVEEVNQVAITAQSAIIAEYRGMNVAEMTDLRATARKADVYLQVIKNTLARRAVANTHFECIQDFLSGPVILFFSRQDPGAPARIVRDFNKTNKNLIVKGGGLGGQAFGATAVDKVAQLPTYTEAISQLMAIMKAPVTKLVRIFVEPYAKLVRTFAAIRDHYPLSAESTSGRVIMSKEEILDTIANMTIMEVVDLISAMEEKFNVSAAVATAAPMAATAAAVDTAPVEEQTEFAVTLTGFGDKKVQVIKAIRAITGLGLKEAKDLVEGVPSVVKEDISKEEASKIKEELEASGATVEIK